MNNQNCPKARPPSPTIQTSRSKPKPSIVYEVLWRFAAERHSMYMNRVAGSPYPWTGDPILSQYRFTNAFRAADRVSQYLIRMAYSDSEASSDTTFLRTMLFKVFNRIDTWESIVHCLGMPKAETFRFEECRVALDQRRRRGGPIYSAAYIMPSGKERGQPKHQMHLQLIQKMLRDGLPEKLAESRSFRDAYELLLAYPTIGRFLAFQYATDLNYTRIMNHPEDSFVISGPGALDGLSKCFVSLGDYSPDDTVLWLTESQDEEFARHDIRFGGLWGRSLKPIDMQNLLCEISKYTRVSHPHIAGIARRTRIKQKFKSLGRLPIPFFPPKWGLETNIKGWLGRKGTARAGKSAILRTGVGHSGSLFKSERTIN